MTRLAKQQMQARKYPKLIRKGVFVKVRNISPIV